MNWKRIWTGAFVAAVVILGSDMVLFSLMNRGGSYSLREWPIVVQSLSDGFFCSCLYAFVRPRLGPGPKTALIVGTTIYFVKHSLGFLWMPHSYQFLALGLFLPWVKYIAATYLAGWQYIEKAP